ncbi:MAG: hypothetical protein IPJ74_22060 [Saprospiraceae bacterium]|nr:hypothetical protein [Saprospiraceae bacterium]
MDAVFGNQKIEHWVAIRILNFLNRVKKAEEIVSGVKDDPNSGAAGEGVAIGETVAKRILEKRNSLQFHRFTSIDQLEGIPGLGEDKIRDLIYTFGVRAADAFRNAMFNGVILDNWKLEHYTYYFLSDQDFNNTVNIPSNFTGHIAHQIERIAEEKTENDRAAYLAGKLIQSAYQEFFESAHLGSYAFAFWLYRFDYDNWFSFERVRLEAEKYLSYYEQSIYELRFGFFKGFSTAGLLTEGITKSDLPIVINPVERAITIWTAELFD